MTDQPAPAFPRPGNTVVSASGVHVGTVMDTHSMLFSVVTLRGTFWFENGLVEDVREGVVRLRCEFVDLEREAKPEPGRDRANGNGNRSS